jgi:hypothetical protein
LKGIILSNWTSQDMRGLRSYATSYTLRQGGSELFTIHLNKQMGFYQISEFLSPLNHQNFIIEQTNRVGTPRIAAFDKESGNMLGAFKGNSLLDSNDTPVLDLKPMSKIADIVCPLIEDSPEDYAGVLHQQAGIGLILSRLPHRYVRRSLLAQARHFARRFSSSPRDVLEMVVVENNVCDLRMLCAIAVIMHSRGGLQLN